MELNYERENFVEDVKKIFPNFEISDVLKGKEIEIKEVEKEKAKEIEEESLLRRKTVNNTTIRRNTGLKIL